MADRLVDLMTDDVIIRCVGVDTFVRGRAYAQVGPGLEIRCQRGPAGRLAVVQGTRPQPYRTIVQLEGEAERSGERRLHLSGGRGLQACRRHPGGRPHAGATRQRPPSPAKPAWERPLAAVVEAHAAEQRSEGTPIALQFEVVAPSRPHSLRQLAGAGSSRASRGCASVLSCPAVRAAGCGRASRGATCRTTCGTRGSAPIGRRLQELYSAYQARGSGYGSYGDHAVFLDDFGPSLWPLLARAVEAGRGLRAGQSQASGRSPWPPPRRRSLSTCNAPRRRVPCSFGAS